MLSKDYKKVREELDNCTRPIYFFHDDADGLCSFLLFYKYKQEGKGIPVKARPIIDSKFLKIVREYEPDKIFVLDVAIVTQEFIDAVKVPVIIVDHHEVLDLNNVIYLNPRRYKQFFPASYLCYKVVNQNMWLATIGCIGDWFIPDFAKEFQKKYPKLLTNINSPGDALFDTEVGKLSEILSFSLKGKTHEVNKVIKVLTRVNDPNELLENKTTQANFVIKRYTKIKQDYMNLLKQVKPTKDKIIFFTYPSDKMSFTGELSNELLHKYPDKVIIIAREKSGEMKCSLRSAKIEIIPILKTALMGVDGYGGGHEYAAGACIKKYDFVTFLENLRNEID